MKYEKPELAVLASATFAIQGGVKQGMVNPDTSYQLPSIGAYEADE